MSNTPNTMPPAGGEYSFVNAKTGERVTAKTLDELRRKGAAILVLDQDRDPQVSLFEKLGMDSLPVEMEGEPMMSSRISPRPRPLTGMRLIGSRAR